MPITHSSLAGRGWRLALALPMACCLAAAAFAAEPAGVAAEPAVGAVSVRDAAPAQGERTPYAIPRSETRTVLSRSGEPYQIMVSWPDGQPPPQGWPVVYALDGNAVFGTLTESARRLARPYGPGQALVPPVIVAIGYPQTDGVNRERRSFDYTPDAPPVADGDPMSRSGLRQGGATEFLDFIQDTLKPLIARDYPVDSQRQTLLGHSFGGLFVLHTLFTRPSAFQSYVAVSPSIWWNGQYILQEAQAFLQNPANAAANAQVLISLGELEQGGRSADPQGGSRAQTLAGQLQASGWPGLGVSFRVHDGETHGSVVPIALARALPDVLRADPAPVR